MGYFKAKILGCPIPIIHLEDGSIKTVPKNDLPVTLNNVDHNTPETLDKHPTWKYTKDKSTGKDAVRETDTLDTFVDSYGIFKILFPSSKNDPFNLDKANYWIPVDQYMAE